MGERKHKNPIIKGSKQKFVKRCHHCGHANNIEARKHGRHRRLYGVTEVANERESA